MRTYLRMNKRHLRFFTWLCAIVFNLLGVSLTAYAQVSDEQALLIKLAINDLVNEYAITRDNGDALGYAGTFAENGSLILFGNTYSNEQLRERIEAENPNNLSMHHMTSGTINVIDENNATGVHYLTLYTGIKDKTQGESSTVYAPNYTVMGKYHDVYVLTKDGWKFAERKLEPIFRSKE